MFVSITKLCRPEWQHFIPLQPELRNEYNKFSLDSVPTSALFAGLE